MKVFIDLEDDNRIKAVGESDDPKLTEFEIIDDDEDNPNPFMGRSKSFICSYKAIVKDGLVQMYTPYRPSSALEYIDEVGHEADDNADKAQAFDIMIGEVEV